MTRTRIFFSEVMLPGPFVDCWFHIGKELIFSSERLGVADEQIGAGLHDIIVPLDQCGSCLLIKVDHHIAAEYGMEAVSEREFGIHKVESPEQDLLLDALFDLVVLLVDTLEVTIAEFWRISSEKLRKNFT